MLVKDFQLKMKLALKGEWILIVRTMHIFSGTHWIIETKTIKKMKSSIFIENEIIEKLKCHRIIGHKHVLSIFFIWFYITKRDMWSLSCGNGKSLSFFCKLSILAIRHLSELQLLFNWISLKICNRRNRLNFKAPKLMVAMIWWLKWFLPLNDVHNVTFSWHHPLVFVMHPIGFHKGLGVFLCSSCVRWFLSAECNLLWEIFIWGISHRFYEK